MYGITTFLTAMVWTADALAQANPTPNQTDATTGGYLYGIGALVAAAMIGVVVYVFIKRNRGRTY